MVLFYDYGRKNSYLLQVKFAPVQAPFHLAGGGAYPKSLKLSCSGQMPGNETKNNY
jgi:hypothetical protein